MSLCIAYPARCAPNDGPIEQFTIVDLIIVVDGSDSVCDSDNGEKAGCTNWDFVKNFLREVLIELPLGERSIRVALIRFSNQTDVIFGLDR